MTILLDHLIVPSHHPVPAAQSVADILGVPWETERGHFTPVAVLTEGAAEAGSVPQG